MKVGSKLNHVLAPNIEAVLAVLEEQGAVLAGGFVRDYILKREFNDVDIFLQEDKNLPYLLEEVVPEALEFVYGEDSVSLQNAPEQYTSYYIRNVVSMTVADVPWQFIILKVNPIPYIKKYFDYSINQVWYDKNGLRSTRSFTDTLYTGEVKQYSKVSYERREDLQNHLKEFKFPEVLKPATNPFTSSLYGSTPPVQNIMNQYQWAWVNGVEQAQ